MLFGIPLETCQHLFYTLVIAAVIFGGLLSILFFTTSLEQDGSDPWIIPVSLCLVIFAVSVAAAVVDGIGLLLYAIWN